MPVVWIPALLRTLTAGEERVVVPGRTVREVVENLDARYPGVQGRLCEEERLKPHITVAINGEVTPEGLQQRIEETSEIHFIPALSGGSLPLFPSPSMRGKPLLIPSSLEGAGEDGGAGWRCGLGAQL